MKEKKSKLPLGSILALFTKAKKMTVIMKSLKAFKASKALITLLSMFISTILYAWAFGRWWFAIGFVVMILIHEMGHVFAARRLGMKASAPVFIPFLGAAIFMPSMGKRTDEAFVGIGGPLLGTFGSLVSLALWYILPDQPQLFLILGYIGIYINLFNMIPISPLDGGRITQIQGTWFKFIGVGVLLLFTIFTKSTDLIFIWILVMMDINHLAAKWKLIISIILGAAYLYFKLTSEALIWWELALDVLLLVMFISMMYLAYVRERKQGFVTDKDDRPYPESSQKIKWLIYYILLTSFLVGCILVLNPYLPKM